MASPEHIVHATISISIPVTATNMTQAEFEARVQAERMAQLTALKLDHVHIDFIEHDSKTFTFDWGCHTYREQI